MNPSLGMDTKFVWGHACQWTCLGWKMLSPWMPRLSTSLSHLKDILYIYELLVHVSIFNNLPCTYFVTISVFPNCICLDFVSNATSFRHSYFLSYKHMYYIYNVCLNLVGNNCTHPPSLNQNDVQNILKLNPFKPFCATWFHIWEYSFQFMVWNFSMLVKCSWIFGS